MSFSVYVKFHKSLKLRGHTYWEHYIDMFPWALHYDHIFVHFTINFEEANEETLEMFVEFLQEVEKAARVWGGADIIDTHHSQGDCTYRLKFYSLLKEYNLVFLENNCFEELDKEGFSL